MRQDVTIWCLCDGGTTKPILERVVNAETGEGRVAALLFKCPKCGARTQLQHLKYREGQQ